MTVVLFRCTVALLLFSEVTFFFLFSCVLVFVLYDTWWVTELS